MPREQVTYFHVELSRHAVMFAEGLAVESYLDIGDRTDFHHRGGVMRLFPDFGARLKPEAAWVWETEGAAPLVMAGKELDEARAVVMANAPQRGSRLVGSGLRSA